MAQTDITRKMLSIIRENSARGTKLITEDETLTTTKEYTIKPNDSQFADVRNSQIEKIIQTVGEQVEFDDDALIYYPQNKDIVLTGFIKSINLSFQFRNSDPSGYGCYLLKAESLPLTDNNYRTIGKIKDAYENWKSALTSDGDLMKRLFDAANQQ